MKVNFDFRPNSSRLQFTYTALSMADRFKYPSCGQSRSPAPQVIFITPTGGRPEAFGLCAQFILRQSFKKWHWVVVDDGPIPVMGNPAKSALAGSARYSYLRTQPRPIEEITLKRNLQSALQVCEAVDCDWIAFMEDDDWYHVNYIERSLEEVPAGCTLIGEANARYYHLPSCRYRMMGNRTHASLSQTIMHRSLLPLLLDILSAHEDSFDILLWQSAWRTSKPFLFPSSTHSIGIKGMPGRPGIGVGHRPKGPWMQDAKCDKFEEWIGADIHLYTPYLNNSGKI